MKNNITIIFFVFLIVLMKTLSSPFLYGEEYVNTEALIEDSDVDSTFTLDMWHYSGGYWKVGNAGSDKITVTNAEMEDRGISTILANEYAEFEIPLPVSVKSMILEGKEIIAKAVTRSTNLSELFDITTFDMNITTEYLYFSAKPIFNLIPERTLSFADYGLFLSGEVPLIDKAYGYNIYSLFGNGESGAQAAGRVSRLAAGVVESGYVHPSIITGLGGALEAGHSIFIRGSAAGSAGFSVGDGTFAAGGAVGLSFSYPVKFQFYEVTEGEIIPPVVTPPAITTPSAIETGVTAVLNLPLQTYEGHPVFAVDSSVFQIGDEEISAVRAYRENLATNRFSILENGVGNISRCTDTQAEVLFLRTGLYNVCLNVETQSGKTGEDVKPITVERTPFIIHALTGTQKQNRKQTLSIAVAQNPLYPVVDLWVELEDAYTGSSVRLSHNFDGNPNAIQNTAVIKTRAIAQKESTEYFINVSLDFLTKNQENQDFIYRIYAEDSRGNTDSVEVTFPVAKDCPPSASIGLAASFLRDKGSNTAIIEVQDQSLTDGDQLERTWCYRSASGPDAMLAAMPGYLDLSFGIGQTVRFNKEGVGMFDVMLDVKDLWVEETLPEYITSADYLTAAAIKSSEVDNVAPVVGLQSARIETAEVLLLAEDQISYQEAESGKAELSRLLLAEGVDADIAVEYVASDGQSESIQNIGKLTVPYGFQGTWSGFWENGSVVSDNTQLYKAEATWGAGATPYDCYPSQPYTIRAYDKKTLAQVWVYTLSAEHFPMGTDRGSTASFGQDNQGRFLYFMIKGKTILLDKKTGAELAILPYLMGVNNSVYEESIFSFKSDGIYRTSMTDGSMRKVLNEKMIAGIGAVQTIHGKETFLIQRGIELLRAAYNPKSQTLDLCRLQGTAQDSGTAVTYLVGIDSAGVIVINTAEGTASKLRAFDFGGKLLYQSDGVIIEAFPNCTVPIYDSMGRINYIGIRTYRKSSSAYYISVALRGLYDHYSRTVSVSHTQGYPTERSQILFGIEKENDTVLVGLGAQWTYIADSGYNNGPVHGMPERAKVFRFNPAAGTAAEGALSDLCPGLTTIAEYGYYSHGSLLVSTGANHQTAESAYHSTSLIDIPESQTSQINRLQERFLAYDADYTFCREISGGFSAQAVADELLEKSVQGENILALTTSTDAGSLSKLYHLNAGQTYYYEYKTTAAKDILVATVDWEEGEEASDLDSDIYAVNREFFEDFNDHGLNAYFGLQESKVSEGLYNMAVIHIDQGSDWNNKYMAASSSIEFIVPEDTLGILSFDYDIFKGTGWFSNFFTLSKDGDPDQIWDELITATKKGGYTNKKLLEAGNYKLTAHARAYGGRTMNSHTKVDNLKVLLVQAEYGSNFSEASANLESASSVRPLGSQNFISGCFTAPNSVLEYAKYDAEWIEGGSATAYSSVTGQAGDYTQTVNIPVGRTALYLGIDTWSNPTITGDDRYNNVTFTWGADQWVCMVNNRYPQSALSNIPKTYRLVQRGLTGNQTIEQRSIVYKNATGGFSGIQAVFSNAGTEVPVEVTDGKFVLSNSALFFENVTFAEEAQIAFSPGYVGNMQISDLKIYTIEDGVRVYLENSSFRRSSVAQEWIATEATASVATAAQEKEEAAALVYKKGEVLSYEIFYSDYEADPSKISYWKYTHTPMNDGLHPSSGNILTEPISRFYIDGKYVLEHWQEDDASRSGFSSYDRASNVCALTFYIEGTAEAPWITSIYTQPFPVEQGDNYGINIGVDDKEKDVLELVTELYHESAPSSPIYSHTQTALTADALGRYPRILIPVPYRAIPGRYDIVAVVRDEFGAGLGTYRFYCISAMKITGQVFHTQGWDQNRKTFNLERFGREEDCVTDFEVYRTLLSPRPRGTNVFWPGERLCLSAKVLGSPLSVSAAMEGYPQYHTLLTKKGIPDALGETLFEGTLWAADMTARLGAAPAHSETVIFTALYPGGAALTYSVEIIFDPDIGYWQLHRLY